MDWPFSGENIEKYKKKKNNVSRALIQFYSILSNSKHLINMIIIITFLFGLKPGCDLHLQISVNNGSMIFIWINIKFTWIAGESIKSLCNLGN